MLNAVSILDAARCWSSVRLCRKFVWSLASVSGVGGIGLGVPGGRPRRRLGWMRVLGWREMTATVLGVDNAIGVASFMTNSSDARPASAAGRPQQLGADLGVTVLVEEL